MKPLPLPRIVFKPPAKSVLLRTIVTASHRPRPLAIPTSLQAQHPLRHAPSPLTLCRHFHPSKPRQDVFFVALPALKSGLLSITRATLLFLPFVFRYKLWKKYKKTSYLLIQIPIFATCIVIALGLDQSPSGRWRLLLMSEHEEIAWSRRKHEEVLRNDGEYILPPEDPRSQRVARVTTRLVTALEEQHKHIVCDASWKPRSSELSRVMSEREASQGKSIEQRYKPSGIAKSGFIPFRPATSNPMKTYESADWNLYVVDMPQLNAFALPTKEIFVYSGLLKTLPDDDALLAAVLAHEIAHVTERHSVENMGFLNVAAVAFDVLRGISFALTISFPFITDSAGMFINWLNDVVAQRAFSRKLEMEADAVGIDLMAVAGYDPRAALDLWEFMSCVEQDAEAAGQSIKIEDRFALLRTHPTSEERQRALEKDLDGAMRLWREHAPRRKSQVLQQLSKEPQVVEEVVIMKDGEKEKDEKKI